MYHYIRYSQFNATWFAGSLFLLKKRDLWNQVKPARRLLFFFIVAQRKVAWPTKEIRGIGMQGTILDRTTWECFFVNAHYLMQQNYFQINSFTQRKPPPQVIFASLMPREGRGEKRITMAMMFRKVLSEYAFLLRVLSRLLQVVAWWPVCWSQCVGAYLV